MYYPLDSQRYDQSVVLSEELMRGQMRLANI